MALRQGGYLLVDDLQLYSCEQLYKLLRVQAGWELTRLVDRKLAVFRKLSAERYLPDFSEEPFIRNNSLECPLG